MTDTIITDPLVTWTLREDGVISFYLEADNHRTRILFTLPSTVSALESAAEQALHAWDLYNEIGYEAAEQYVDEIATRFELTDDDMSKFDDDNNGV